MDHEEAVETMAAQRYVLEEMTPEDRDAFEHHFFGCAACAADVRDGATIAATLRSARPQTAAVPRPSRAGWLAAAASLAIVALLGYQNAALRGRLHRQSEPQVLRSYTLANESRGGESEMVVDNASQPFGLYIDVPPRPNATRYVVTIFDGAGHVRISQPVTLEQARESVQLLIPGGLLAPGHYSVRARSEPVQPPDSEWSFVVR